jgi:carboxymethylenebutenolidase
MSGTYETVEGKDGAFKAYVAAPAGAPTAAIVVIQEIFGVNAVMRQLTDEFAAHGYLAICPDLFWRLEPGIELTDQTTVEWDEALGLMKRFEVDKGVEDIAAAIDYIRADPRCTGKVGAVGYCLGGRLAFLTAARTDADAAVGYYGVGLENLLGETIKAPLLLHIAGRDSFSSKDAETKVVSTLKDNPLVTLAIYPDRDHAFARPGGEHFDATDAALAEERTLAHLKAALA